MDLFEMIQNDNSLIICDSSILEEIKLNNKDYKYEYKISIESKHV